MTKATGNQLHQPVMCQRVVQLLSPALKPEGAVLVDCTLGLGGHAQALLEAAPQAVLVGIDRDPEALELAGERLAKYSGRVQLFHGVFDEFARVLAESGNTQAQAVLMDLGLSSLQIDRRERGFTYMSDAPLDMRMDQSRGRTAADIVNAEPPQALAATLRELGDEKYAARIAQAIAAARPLQTTAELVQVIQQVIPRYANTGGHPAKRTFQALRIAVNSELEALAATLPVALGSLAPGGRMAVLSYHSGEDRLVKAAFAAATSDRAPRKLPVVPPELAATHELITRGAERPSNIEIFDNPRAVSARLRAVERKAL